MEILNYIRQGLNSAGYKIILLLAVLSFGTLLSAQEIGLKVDFFGYADNREFGSPYTLDKTIFGASVSPQLLFHLDTNHHLLTGVNYNQEVGLHPDNKGRLNPIVYYNYTSRHIDFAIGFIPRYPRLKNIPKLVLADTFMYDRPNLEGMYFEYKNNNMRQSVFIDWLSQKSDRYREQFIAGINGHAKWGLLFLDHSGILFHNSLTSKPDSGTHLQDNAVITASMGVDLSKRTFLDSMTVDAGGVLGFDRLRSVYPMRKKAGFISTIFLGYSTFFLKNTLYLGQVQTLPNGDPFYHRKRYNRLDLGWTPFRNERLEARLTASFHFTKGFIDNQQAFTLRYHFGSKPQRRRSD